MILLLDNYDSFTYNLVQYLGELGELPKVYRNNEITVPEIQELKPARIVLSPGPGRPENSGIMNELIDTMKVDTPILGVCLGHQAIVQVFGGKIGYAPKIMHGKTSQIHHNNSRLFDSIKSPFEATRYHSLVAVRESFPQQLKITAWTDDNVIMALEHESLPIFGVQFHPESILTVEGKKILKNFLAQ